MRFIFSVLLILFICQISFARTVDLFPLHFQYRYEDTADQAIETVLYQSYSVGVTVDKVRGSLVVSSLEDSTGNPSLRIETKVEELLLGVGYQVFDYTKGQMTFHVLPQIFVGSTQTRAETKLLASSSTSSSSKQMVYGMGAELLARMNYFVAGFEMNIMNSKNFSPQVVPAVHVKIGAGIPF